MLHHPHRARRESHTMSFVAVIVIIFIVVLDVVASVVAAVAVLVKQSTFKIQI